MRQIRIFGLENTENLEFLSVVLKHGLGGWVLDEMNNEIRVVIDETRKKQRLQIVKWRSGSNLS